MMDLDTLARHHADRARESVAGAVPPPLTVTVEARPPHWRVPKPVWAVLAAIAVLVLLGLPALLREPAPEPTPITTPDRPGVFVPTGRLNAGCAWCQAIILDDGRVLVLGQQPESYDPATETFSTIEADGAVGNARSAVMLEDGRVLTSDGNTQWLFDPAATSFQLVGELPAAVMARLGDGRVLLLGHPSEIEWNRTFLFDPESGELAEGPNTLHPHGDGLSGAVVSMLDGRVLLLGTSHSEIFDPVTGSFADVGGRLARSGFTATLLSDGRVLIVGGQEESEPYDMVEVAEIFDPSTGEFTAVGELHQGRFWHATALLPDGRVLVIGGADGDLRAGLDQAEIYDPSTGEFEPVAVPMTRERVAPGAVTLADGSVLIMGHYPGNAGGSSEGTSTAELFTFGSVADDAGSAAENPTEVERMAEYQLSDLAPAQPSPLELEARLLIPAGSLDGMTAVAVMASLDIVGEASTGTVVASLGTPIEQELTISETGGTGGGGEVSLPPECDAGCDLKIPVTVSWTGVDGLPPAVIGLRLQVAYQGRHPDAAEDLELTIAQP